MAAASKVSLKLFIDAKEEKVLYAEAGKDFVDFLFNILSLPVGTVVRLLKKNEMVGCLGNLYESIENLDEKYIEPGKNKNSLLKPVIPTSCASQNPLLLLDGTSSSTEKKIQFASGAPAENAITGGGNGYVQGVVTYMIMDNLSVMPLSTTSNITNLLNKFNIKEVGNLEERIVSLDMGEGVKLLKASLESKMVFTSVFLGQNNVGRKLGGFYRGGGVLRPGGVLRAGHNIAKRKSKNID